MRKSFRLRLLTIILFLLIPACAVCQEFDSPFGKGKKNRNICLRAEVGWNKSWFTSLGASYFFCNVNSHAPLSLVIYTSAEANLAGYRSPATFYAYKAGFEFGGMLVAMGAELRNNTDFAGKNHLVFTPKIGLTLFGQSNLFYGYNVFNNANNIFGIGYSQLSFNMNINRKILKEPLVPKE